MEDVLDLLSVLVGLDTTSRRSNLPLVDRVGDRLASAGASVDRLPDESGDKAGLLARLGPEAPGGVVLSGHTDCVPVDGQDWSHEPFTLHRDGDRVVGRGTADMKGFIATAVTVLTGAGELRRPVWLALSRDEELGTLGAPDVVAGLRRRGADPEAIVVGEPTGMQPVTAHKGVRSFRTRVTGTAAHSSQPHRGANAVAAAARLAVFLDDLAAEHRATVTDRRFDPPCTTVNTAVIEGGTAVNIVPDACELIWEYRPVPADDDVGIRDRVLAFVDEEIVPRLRRDVPGGQVVTDSTAVVPTLAPDDGAAARLVGGLDGVAGEPTSVAYGTDGGHFQSAGWSTVVCGPGSIDHAHRPDEFVTVDQLARCRAMVEGVVARAAAAV